MSGNDKAQHLHGISQWDARPADCLKDERRDEYVIGDPRQCLCLQLQPRTKQVAKDDNAENRHYHIQEDMEDLIHQIDSFHSQCSRSINDLAMRKAKKCPPSIDGGPPIIEITIPLFV